MEKSTAGIILWLFKVKAYTIFISRIRVFRALSTQSTYRLGLRKYVEAPAGVGEGGDDNKGKRRTNRGWN